MKKFSLILLLFSTLCLGKESIPEKLILSANQILDNPLDYPAYRIELILFTHLMREPKDLEEDFYNLNEFQYSNDLIKLIESPSLLVNQKSIEQGLVENKQVIKNIIHLPTDSPKINIIDEETEKANNNLLPYGYFELVDSKDLLELSKRLNKNKDYEVLFNGSWFQPIFNESLASPVYIQSDNKEIALHGELLLYKERFLHSFLNLRLSKKYNSNQDFKTIYVHDFNKLLNLSKAENRFFNFFKSIGEGMISFSSWVIRSKEFSPITEKDEDLLIINRGFKDQYEIKRRTKMKENEFYYVDHPYFGAVIRISLWN
tara:strand:- start:6782 stop:7729 length:948 start_codon:yes stop_codon:yes gene_type:complete